MSFHSKFEEDLKNGKIYEKRSLLYLEYDKYKMIEGNFKEYDLEIVKDNKKIKIEVKSDKQASITNNLAIEYKYNNKKSGISSTTADYYIYFILYPNEIIDGKKFSAESFHREEVYKIPVGELKIIVKTCQKVNGGDGNKSKIYLVPKNIVQKYLINIFSKNNIAPYILPMTTEQKPTTYNQKLIAYFKEDSTPEKSYTVDEIEKLINYFSKMEYEKKKDKTDEMPFGKYRFHKVKEVANFDKQYLIWLNKQNMLDKYVELKAEIKKYL